MSENLAAGWLVQLALGGGVLLLLARLVMMRVSAPALRQRLGEVGVLSALLLAVLTLGPRWLPVRLPAWMVPSAPPIARQAERVAPSEQQQPDLAAEKLPGFAIDLAPQDVPAAVPAPAMTQSEPARQAPTAVDWRARIETALVVGYAGVAGLFLLRWLPAHAALAWLLRGATPAPEAVAELLAELAPGQRLRLVMSPRGACRSAAVYFGRPWYFRRIWLRHRPGCCAGCCAHEKTHLERRDGWAGLLLALGQAAFFFVPWFWWLRRQVRLCQEYVADAAAVAAGGRPEDYAEFLLGWVAAPPAPVVGHGVFGSSSDLYQRITQLLQARPSPSAAHPRRWLVVASATLLSLAVFLSGLYVQPPRASAEAVAPLPPDEVEKTPPAAVAPVPNVEKPLDRLPPFPFASTWLTVSREPRLGVQIRPPEPALAAQLTLPTDTGMVLEEVSPTSTAAKMGLKSHDVLLELAGKSVPSNREKFARLMESVPYDMTFEAVVLRKGKRETIKDLALAEAKGDATAEILIIPR